MKWTVSVFSILVLASVAMVRPAYADQAVLNGSFEDLETTGWECDLNCTLVVNAYFTFSATLAVDGWYYLYLLHDAGVYQTVSVPSTAETLSLWYDNQLDGEEEGAFDVQLLDPDTLEVYASETFSAQSDTWQEGTVTIPESVRGQDVIISIANSAGFNRIDQLIFTEPVAEEEEPPAEEEDEEDVDAESYASLKLRIRSAKGKPVKKATVYVKQDGAKLTLIKVKTNETTKKLSSNAKGNVPKFLIAQELVEGDTVKLCVKKKTVTECAKLSPEAGVLTTLRFTFESKKVK